MVRPPRDFLLERGGRFVAVEAKSARRVPDRALAGLRALAALRGVSRRLVVYLGDERLRTTDGIDVLPVPAFLDLLDAGRLF